MEQKTLYEQRTALFDNAIRFRHNDRTPTFSNFFTWRIFDAGYRLSEAILNYDVMEKVLRRFQETYRFDAHFDLGSRNPLRISNALGGKKYTIDDESGAVSYLDESLMTAEQYDALIENPAAFTWEVILKNHLPELTLGQLKNGALELIQFMQFSEHINKVFVEEYQCKLGLDATRPAGVPFETLFQTYRGMVGISKDLRRCPERVEQALQVLFETTIAPQLKACDFSAPTPCVASNYIIMMAHSILNEKQFARFYWPHFKAIFDAVHAQNGTMFVFSEAQILRFADFMDEIPKGSMMVHHEQDDIYALRKRLPNIALAGGMPSVLLANGTKQECVDCAKKLVEDMGDGYVFSTDKMMSFRQDCNAENLKATMDFVLDYHT